MNIGEYLLIDSHCHPHFLPLGDSVETVLADMTAAGVQAALAVATSEQEAQEVLALCKKYPERFFAACGIHPLSDDDEKDDDEAVIKLCADEKVLAVGETGLDFFRAGDSKAAQRRRFAAHIAAARRLQKPLIIHTRDSIAAVLDMLRAENASEVGGVLHCYTGGTEGAKAALDINFIVSFTGIISFKKSDDMRAVAKFVPADGYMVETDAPYLAPVPHRGKTNTPAYVRHVAEATAAARGVSLSQVAIETTQTFNRLFKKS